MGRVASLEEVHKGRECQQEAGQQEGEGGKVDAT